MTEPRAIVESNAAMIENVKLEIQNDRTQIIQSTKVIEEAEGKNIACLEREKQALIEIEDMQAQIRNLQDLIREKNVLIETSRIESSSYKKLIDDNKTTIQAATNRLIQNENKLTNLLNSYYEIAKVNLSISTNFHDKIKKYFTSNK
jgi:hypothetical protein